MESVEHVYPGQSITAQGYNRMVDAVNSLLAETGVKIGAPQSTLLRRFDLVEITNEDEELPGSGDIKPGSVDKTVSVLTRDDHAHPDEDQWTWAEHNAMYTMDPQMGIYLAGERHLTYFHPGAGARIPLPGVIIQVARANEAIDANANGDVEIQRWYEDEETWDNSGITVEAKNVFGGSIDENAKVLIVQHLQSRLWLICPPAFNPPTRTCGDPVFDS